jgi:hypothetical protein
MTAAGARGLGQFEKSTKRRYTLRGAGGAAFENNQSLKITLSVSVAYGYKPVSLRTGSV